jgi:hypothetical protein
MLSVVITTRKARLNEEGNTGDPRRQNTMVGQNAVGRGGNALGS